jgi:para-aminobenzoate synthetase component 1
LINKVVSLPYYSKLIEHYQAFRTLPGFVLLQSTDLKRGRFDILSAYPHDQIQIPRTTSSLEQDVARFAASLPNSRTSTSSFPFQGGPIGYIAYDLGALLQGIEEKTHPVLKDMPLLDMGYYNWAIIADHHKRIVNLVSFDSKMDKSFLREMEYLWSKPADDVEFKIKNNFSPLVSKSHYENALETIHEYLNKGRIYQVNYTQPFTAKFCGDPWMFYKNHSQSNPVPFAAFLAFDNYEILSFSPERMLLYDQGDLTSSPIKGSAPRSKIEELDRELAVKLSLCEKNKAENVMIVDLVRNDLGKIAEPGSVKVTKLLELQSFNGVHHLVSTVVAKARADVSPWECFMSIFPCGSITGAPKLEAMRVISELENTARGVYCGAIGYFSSHGRSDFNIAIRTIASVDNYFYLGVGGGIVMDSNTQEEYAECYTKIAALFDT